jgi:Protein of unknown function (DUF2934)
MDRPVSYFFNPEFLKQRGAIMPHTSPGTGSKEVSKRAAPEPQSTNRKKNKTASSEESGGDRISREEMISVAAYFRAEHRGFGEGDSLADWLAAEAEIDAVLNNREDIKVH